MASRRPCFFHPLRSRRCRTLSPCPEPSRVHRRTARARRFLSARRATGISCRAGSTEERDVYIPPQSTDATVACEACPFCHSPNVTTTSKEINVSTYWRCTACGQIWNAARLQGPQRRPYDRF